METINYIPAGPVVERFHQSDAFVRGLMGPVGSSKSSACCMEIFDRACRQAPHKGTRYTKWAILRNTYPELKSTTIETFLQWFPMAQMKWDAPITAQVQQWLPDKTRIDIKVLFMPLENPKDIDKLGSLEITGAFMNEAREMSLSVMEKLTERVGRYPPKKWSGGCTWRGVIMDTNPPDDDSWWFGLAEGADREKVEQMLRLEEKLRNIGYLKPGQKLYEFFKQPGGLMEVNGELVENPDAENIENLDGGYAYYFRQSANKSKQWIKAQILGQYATIAGGKPVYPEWNDDLHCKEVKPYPGLPLILGFDFGLTPACVICQVSPKGQFCVLDELVSEDMGIEQFSRDVVKPHLALHYPGFSFQGVGDPSGMSRKDTDEKTCFMELAEQGIPCVPASSNNPTARTGAVSKYLTRMTAGKPSLVIDPKCSVLRRGFNGQYKYKRIQVAGDESRFQDVPDKNKYSHPHDALQYAALYSLTMNNNEFWSKKIEYPKMGIV